MLAVLLLDTSTLTGLGTAAGILVAIVMVGGAVTAGYYAVHGGGLKQARAIDKDTIEALTSQNAVQKSQIEMLQTAAEALKADLRAERAHSVRQDQEIAQLKELVQGVKAIAALSQKIDHNHQQLLDAIKGGGS